MDESKVKKAMDELLRPGSWEYVSGQMIYARSTGGVKLEDREHKLLDVRGWGHFLYLGEEEAKEIQDRIGEMVTKLPDLINACTAAYEFLDTYGVVSGDGEEILKQEELFNLLRPLARMERRLRKE